MPLQVVSAERLADLPLPGGPLQAPEEPEAAHLAEVMSHIVGGFVEQL